MFPLCNIVWIDHNFICRSQSIFSRFRGLKTWRKGYKFTIVSTLYDNSIISDINNRSTKLFLSNQCASMIQIGHANKQLFAKQMRVARIDMDPIHLFYVFQS